MKHPETADLAQKAYDASGAKTHGEFVQLMQGAIPLRTFRRWLAGESPLDGLAQLVLREVAGGWKPAQVAK
jgi:hypothetical protein